VVLIAPSRFQKAQQLESWALELPSLLHAGRAQTEFIRDGLAPTSRSVMRSRDLRLLSVDPSCGIAYWGVAMTMLGKRG
jgi:hypothetical protein